MHTTDLSAVALAKADVPLAPDERLREVAAILAAGLLRLRTPACAALTLRAAGRRPQMAGTTDILGEHAAPTESAESARKALGFCAHPRTDPHAG